MTSTSSQNVLSVNEYKDVLEEESTLKKPYSETDDLYKENKLLPRPVWFKGIGDRGFREDIAA
tara:strand:- start:378 stop:566 length:189 start_codon:yes stop_codon:yes gene_type:complete